MGRAHREPAVDGAWTDHGIRKLSGFRNADAVPDRPALHRAGAAANGRSGLVERVSRDRALPAGAARARRGRRLARSEHAAVLRGPAPPCEAGEAGLPRPVGDPAPLRRLRRLRGATFISPDLSPAP